MQVHTLEIGLIGNGKEQGVFHHGHILQAKCAS